MYQSLANKALRRAFAASLLVIAAGGVSASGLTIEEAGRLALKDDYTLKAINAHSEAMSELAIATGKLPDPQLKLGFANLPTDSFNLGQ